MVNDTYTSKYHSLETVLVYYVVQYFNYHLMLTYLSNNLIMVCNALVYRTKYFG